MVTELAFKVECARKDKLMALFGALENEERGLKQRKKFKYDRMVRDFVTVAKIKSAHLELKRENGESLKGVRVNEQITALLREDDGLGVTLGKRGDEWSIVFVHVIASPFPGPTPNY